jgi:hypothetical protein
MWDRMSETVRVVLGCAGSEVMRDVSYENSYRVLHSTVIDTSSWLLLVLPDVPSPQDVAMLRRTIWERCMTASVDTAKLKEDITNFST